MAQTTFSVHFFIRSNRMDEQGFAPIYSRININGQMLKMGLNHKIEPKNWDKVKEMPKSNIKDSKLIQNGIEAFKSRIYQAYSKILATNADLTTASLKAAFLGKVEKVQVYTLIETFKAHNEYFESLIGVKYSYGSYKNYKTTLKYLLEFVPQYANKKDILLQDVNYRFCEAFFQFLTTQKNCNVNGANKQMQRIKKVVNEAIRKGFINTNPMATFKLQFTPVNKVALTIDEIGKIEKLKLQRDALKSVRDIFLLQCYTGLAYSDIKRLNHSNIQIDGSKTYWIRMERQKTGIAFVVPLMKQAIDLLKSFGFNSKSNSFTLPILSNQKMNSNLKIIQELAGISKPLTTHLARHTFATTITLGNGVPIETVSKMLGHTKISTTQQYAKVLEDKIGRDMKDLLNKGKT